MSRGFAFLAFVLVACGGQVDAGSVDSGKIEAQPDAPPDAPETLAKCCALGTPSCGCTVVGTQEDGNCLSLCDAKPVGWTKAIDAHGCPKWNVPADSCLDTPPPPSCPGVASFCPVGCAGMIAAEYNAARDCVNVGSGIVGCLPVTVGCTAAISCFVRLSDGKAFRFSSGCSLEGWRACTAAERDKVIGARYCEGVDAGGLPD